MNRYDPIYSSFCVAVIIIYLLFSTRLVELSHTAVYGIVNIAVAWTIIRQGDMFIRSNYSNVTLLFSALFLIGIYNHQILSLFEMQPVRLQPISIPSFKATNLEANLQTGLPSDD